MLSKFKNKLFFGLPGNPISMVVGFRFFIYPLIRNMLGMNKEKKFKAKLLNKYSKQKVNNMKSFQGSVTSNNEVKRPKHNSIE